jgi:predicted RNA-binding protein associated with RNAse of E/G family
LIVLSVIPALAGNTDKEKAEVVSAEKWLGLVDSEKYTESWTEASELFKNSITQEQWKRTVEAVRKPLGKIITRKLSTKTYTTSLPGVPDGEYVVIQFNTSFENKKSAIETITPMKDKDGKWRVSGYYIK